MQLATRLRPRNLDEFVGQQQLVGKGKILRQMIEESNIYPMIFWGPPGTGKTTLAHIIAKAVNANLYELSGVESGKADFQDIVKKLQNQLSLQQSILFIDEIHRWNKAQQDALLPYVENGIITLIGATTENPSFTVNSALLSRCRVFVLEHLTEDDLDKLVSLALTDKERGLGKYQKTITPEAQSVLLQASGGDARILLNGLEIAVTAYSQKTITPEIIQNVFQHRSASIYDKKADEHYNLISAFIKSMRGSDPDAALYYMTRMLENGEDPRFLARRMIIFSSEDIGLADTDALQLSNAAFTAVANVGMPEAQLILSHVCIYLAKAKKSRTVPNAMGKVKEAVYEFPNEPVPLDLRNAPTKLMKDLNYGKNYMWSEEEVGLKNSESYLPKRLEGKKFYQEEKYDK